MTIKFYAKPILENRFWILESNGEKVGTICRQEDRRYMFSCSDGTRIFDTQQQRTYSLNLNMLTTLDSIKIEIVH